MKGVFLLISLLYMSFSSVAQCNSFTKNNCLTKLDGYIHTGQMNSSSLSPGEKVEFKLTFYKGQEYRIMVCHEQTIEQLTFKVMDSKRRLLYDNLESKTNTLNFKVASTQQLIISIASQKSNSNNQEEVEGCVSAIVGFKF
jgi:hypothetical protein